MYRCDECREIFDEPVIHHAFVIAEPYYPSVYMDEEVCPYCGSTDFTTVHLCENCENEITEHTYCDKCKDEAVKYMHELEKATAGQDVKGLLAEVLED